MTTMSHSLHEICACSKSCDSSVMTNCCRWIGRACHMRRFQKYLTSETLPFCRGMSKWAQHATRHTWSCIRSVRSYRRAGPASAGRSTEK